MKHGEEYTELWIVVRNWDRFQHYRDRRPSWVKTYTELLADQNYLKLSLRHRGILHGIWLAYAASRQKLGASPAQLGRMLGSTQVRARDLKRLEQAGFIELLLAPRACAREEEKKEHAKGTQSQELSVSPKAFSVAREAEELFDFAKINYLPKEMP